MIVNRFNYPALSRTSENGQRLYQTPDGKRLPSVTTILDRTKPEESRRALAEWKKRVGTEKAQQITTEAANRGTRMHTYLEQYVKTGTMPQAGTNPYSWASHEMANVMIEHGLKNVDEFWAIEQPLYFPNLYAGTTDGCGIHLGDEAILDYKQSNKEKKREWIGDYFLQTVFYGTAHNEVYGTKIRKGVILMCVKPELDLNHNIIVPPKYQEFIVEGDEWDHYEKLMWQRLEQYYLIDHPR